MGDLRHAQGVNDNPLITIDFKSKHPYIVRQIFELLRPHFRGLDVTGF